MKVQFSWNLILFLRSTARNDNIARSNTESGNIRNHLGGNSVVLVQEGAEIKMLPVVSETVTGATHDDVHITPSYIEFKEASEGITCRQRITIKNAGSRPAFVRIRQPNSIAFQVKTLKSGVMLNPGLSVSTCVTYSFKRPSLLRAMIPIEINGKVLDYRVVCTLTTEGISIEPKSIDFGTIDIGYSSGLKIITLSNEGGKSTRFSIDLGKNDLEITVKPLRGIVRPNKQVQLRVELIGMNEGVFYSEFWIKSVPNIRVPLTINVIVPRLVAFHPNTTGDFTLIDFPPTVENTRRYDTFVLRNLSSQVASYVVLGEIGNEVKSVRGIDRKKYPIYDAFEVRPIQGRMDPFEGIVFEVGFMPTSKLMRWRQRSGEKKSVGRSESSDNDFMAFIRIARVHVTETEDILRVDPTKDVLSDNATGVNVFHDTAIMDISSSSTSSASSFDSGPHDTVRLCLHGEVEIARLFFEPDILYFGELHIGEISQRVVRVSNCSKSAPLVFRYVRHASARCYPECVKLKPEEAIEVVVKVKGKENGSSNLSNNVETALQSYSSPSSNSPEALSVKQAAFKAKERLYWATYLRSTSLARENVMKQLVNENGDDDGIIKNILRIPEWKYKKVSEVRCNPAAIEKSLVSKTKAEVLIPLSPLQIYNVHIFPTIFTFGMVAPKSHNYRQLIVENRNEFPVMIRLISLSSRCIHFPEGNLIILSAGSIITRLVEFRADHIGKFNGYIDYVINDNHSFELSITADVVHKQLSLDKREIIFGNEHASEEMYQPADAVIQIKNKLDAETCFRWEIPTACGFFVEPLFGSVRGNSILYTNIYYKPDARKANYTEVVMRCESGSYINVRLSIPSRKPKVSFMNDNIDVGEIPLNLLTKTTAVLRSLEVTEVVYEVDSSSLVHGIKVYPSRGVIHPRGVVILDVQMTFDMCLRFSTVIRVTVQRCLNLQLKITGRVSFPRLKLVPQCIEARRISVDAYQCYPITATNVGATTLKLNFILEEYPEFRVSLSPSRKDPDVGDEDIFIVPGNNQNFYLHFEPVDLANYIFYLPIVINNILGPPSITNPKTVKPLEYLNPEYYEKLPGFNKEQVPEKFATISMDCTVAGHVVFFNKLIFDFNASKCKTRDELIIENRELPRETSVLIEIDSFCSLDCPFSIQWSDGVEPMTTSTSIECTLQPGERTIFIIEFHPKQQGNFSLEAPIFVRDQLDGKVFNKLCLRGGNSMSFIDVENPEIYFSPIPLCTTIEEKIWLRLWHFESSAIIMAKIHKPRIHSGDYTDEVLSVQFPQGNVVSASEYSELPVNVTFKSDTTISLRSTIEFHDDQGLASFSVTIYATAENNLLTIHAYVRKSIAELQRGRNFENRVNYHSVTSSSVTDEEDHEDSQQTLLSHRNKGSLPRISVHSYFERRSRGSLGKIMESKFKLTKEEYTDVEENVVDYDYTNVDENVKDSPENEEPECLPNSPSKPRKSSAKLMSLFQPTDERKDDYELHMAKTIKAAEQWLYSTGFKFSFYPDIPNGITASLSNFSMKKKKAGGRQSDGKGKKHTFESSFIDVLECLAGSQVYQYLGKLEPLPEKDAERVDYVVRLYDKTLCFLMDHGACLTHVSAQFLLSYRDYLITVNPQRNDIQKLRWSKSQLAQPETLSQPLFEFRSKQCWLDVILQTYKCFVLTRISEIRQKRETTSVSLPPSRRSTMHRSSTVSSMSSLSKQSLLREKAIRNAVELTRGHQSLRQSTEELFLLAWLSYYYEQERVQEWMTDRRLILNPNKNKDVAYPRTVQNFDQDLSDSLVLIAVTAAHCPFLIEECFSNLYICPTSYEEVVHNAICVVNAWRKIRLGFVIVPLEIVYPNCVQMLMLVVHLFEMLPTYIPRAKIKCSCPLTEIVTRQISFTNPTSFNVGYFLLFVGNDSGFFTVANSQTVLRLSGHDSTLVKIQFHARKIRKLRAYLLFCGSVIGPHFDRSQTFILEGQADSLGITNEYVISSKLYEIVEKTLSIKVPYGNMAEYEIWMSEEQPNKPSTLKMVRWSELCTRKIPRRLFLNQKSIMVTEGTREGRLSITVSCIVPVHRSFWLIFQSKLGDFIVQINSRWQASLTDRLVIEWTNETNECTCPNATGDINTVCPFNVKIPIPSRNEQLWSCVAHMFQKTLDSKERLFWSRYLDTNIGLSLIRWLMGENTDSAALEFVHIFDRAIAYSLTLSDKSSPLVIPETFTINDVRPPNKSTPMIVHIVPSTSLLYETTLTLTSLNGKELRVYSVNFLRK